MNLKSILASAICILAALSSCSQDVSSHRNSLRASAYPLITIDPYTNGWSMADHLYDAPVKHWTEKDFPLIGAVKVDGEIFRFMGVEDGVPADSLSDQSLSQTATQTFADVQPTATHYGFTCGPVFLGLDFMAPLLLDDLELISRPVNYISYKVSSTDGKPHTVQIYFEASPLWAVDNPSQETLSSTLEDGALVYVCAEGKDQKILGSCGDDRRIEWGRFYMAADKYTYDAGIGSAEQLRKSFKLDIKLSTLGCEGENEAGRMALSTNLGSVKEGQGHISIGYDDLYSIQYFGENLRAYWNKDGQKTIFDAFSEAERDYESLADKCESFDRKLMRDAQKAGGRNYAELCALAYRQAIHAHKLVQAPNGDLLWLSKENNSNGSIGTVDVTYPSAPLFLLYNTSLAEGLLNHIFYFSESGRWTKPFPSHDVGTYPLANGQTYGGDMPIEEAGNMVILTAAICHYSGDASYAQKHWETLTTWTDYMLQFGLDPENQLCTDDFAGHFAHNTNLSIKAILGIASYAKMAQMLGKEDIALSYMNQAKTMAAKWMEMADDGDHYRLTFDKPGTWSQKYNLVWDKLLGLNVFPESVAEKELAWYLKNQNIYGLPLDNRRTYTKTDWIIWTATTVAKTGEDFDAFIAPICKFENETTDRVPMSDWIYTDKPVRSGFKARSVVGGYFIKLLSETK